MIYEVVEGEKGNHIELVEVGENLYEVTTDGDTTQISVMAERRTILSLIENGTQFECIVDQGRGETLDVTVSGKLFNFTVVDERAMLLSESDDSQVSGPQRVVAEMPGKILTVEVDLGDRVAQGQVVMVVEAMKMENPIQSPVDGVVLEINAKAGDVVEGGALLFIIDSVSGGEP